MRTARRESTRPAERIATRSAPTRNLNRNVALRQEYGPVFVAISTTNEAVADADDGDLINVFGRHIEYRYVVALVYVTALFLDILDTTIVNVAVFPLGEKFHSNNAEWIVLGYTLSLAVWIPASATASLAVEIATKTGP